MLTLKSKQIILIVLLAIVGFTAVRGAMKPDAGLLKFKVDGAKAYGYGGTTGRSLSDFKGFIKDNPQVRTLVLMKMPGTEDGTTNTKIARLIRKEGLDTHLTKNSYIASGAVDLFLAGKTRTMECGALIGVHSWAYYSEKGLVRGKSFHPKNMGVDPYQKEQEDFLSDMGVDPAFYVFTREAALPEDIYILTPEDINRFGLLTTPTSC